MRPGHLEPQRCNARRDMQGTTPSRRPRGTACAWCCRRAALDPSLLQGDNWCCLQPVAAPACAGKGRAQEAPGNSSHSARRVDECGGPPPRWSHQRRQAQLLAVGLAFQGQEDAQETQVQHALYFGHKASGQEEMTDGAVITLHGLRRSFFSWYTGNGQWAMECVLPCHDSCAAEEGHWPGNGRVACTRGQVRAGCLPAAPIAQVSWDVHARCASATDHHRCGCWLRPACKTTSAGQVLQHGLPASQRDLRTIHLLPSHLYPEQNLLNGDHLAAQGRQCLHCLNASTAGQ